MRKILAPHGEQDGWVYVRVEKAFAPQGGWRPGSWSGGICWLARSDDSALTHATYTGYARGCRTISSRRVEEAIETADYLKRCAEEGLSAYWMTKPRGSEYTADGKTPVPFPCWVIERWVGECEADGLCGAAPTLREAYHRYKNAAQ